MNSAFSGKKVETVLTDKRDYTNDSDDEEVEIKPKSKESKERKSNLIKIIIIIVAAIVIILVIIYLFTKYHNKKNKASEDSKRRKLEYELYKADHDKKLNEYRDIIAKKDEEIETIKQLRRPRMNIKPPVEEDFEEDDSGKRVLVRRANTGRNPIRRQMAMKNLGGKNEEEHLNERSKESESESDTSTDSEDSDAHTPPKASDKKVEPKLEQKEENNKQSDEISAILADSGHIDKDEDNNDDK